MDLKEAETLARKLIGEWLPAWWQFAWSNSVNTHGSCYVGPYPSGDGVRFVIYLSRPHTWLNTREIVEDTIRHEIAHALADPHGDKPGDGHGPEWQANAIRVGARPEACAGPDSVGVPHKWVATCESCGGTVGRHRRSRDMANGDYACATCCRERNGGKYDARFRLDFKKQW